MFAKAKNYKINSKDIEKKFVGQPIFKPFVNFSFQKNKIGRSAASTRFHSQKYANHVILKLEEAVGALF